MKHFTAVSLLILSSHCIFANNSEPAHTENVSDLANCSLTKGFFGLNDQLSKHGIETTLTLTQIYQQNVRRGLSTHSGKGRYTGSYDLELSADLEKFIGLPGASAYMLTEGSWSNGINETSVGSNFNVNSDALGTDSAAIAELWYEQMLGSDFAVRVGKIDLTCGFEAHNCPLCFDGNRYANDENTLFLNGALVNNPTIPFPNNGLGAILFYNPSDLWYASAGISDADSRGNTSNFDTAFHDTDNFFSIFETGLTPVFDSSRGPLPGTYRVGFWYDPQKKERFEDQTIKRDDNGFYLSFDQLIIKENADRDDLQGLGLFGRYGKADGSVNTFTSFVSGGLSYQGLFENRDDDILAAGIGYGTLTDEDEFQTDSEIVYEMFYNAQITKYLQVSPDIQYIHNPGGSTDVSDALVLGLRVLLVF